MSELAAVELDPWEQSWDDAVQAQGPHDYVSDLQAAVDTFSDIAASRQCDHSKADAGALALHVFARSSSDPDVVDAAVNLKSIATAGRIDICTEGRVRAAQLAQVVAKFRTEMLTAQPLG